MHIPGTPGMFLGEERKPLPQLGFAGKTVDVACSPKSPRGYELAIRVEKTAEGAARAAGWDIMYRSGGHTSNLKSPLAVVLCYNARISKVC